MSNFVKQLNHQKYGHFLPGWFLDAVSDGKSEDEIKAIIREFFLQTAAKLQAEGKEVRNDMEEIIPEACDRFYEVFAKLYDEYR